MKLLQHGRVQHEETATWNKSNMKEFNMRKVEQLKVQHKRFQSEKGIKWIEPNT